LTKDSLALTVSIKEKLVVVRWKRLDFVQGT